MWSACGEEVETEKVQSHTAGTRCDATEGPGSERPFCRGRVTCGTQNLERGLQRELLIELDLSEIGLRLCLMSCSGSYRVYLLDIGGVCIFALRELWSEQHWSSNLIISIQFNSIWQIRMEPKLNPVWRCRMMFCTMVHYIHLDFESYQRLAGSVKDPHWIHPRPDKESNPRMGFILVGSCFLTVLKYFPKCEYRQMFHPKGGRPADLCSLRDLCHHRT